MRAIPLVPLLLGGWLVLPVHADDAQDQLKRLAQAEQQQASRALSFMNAMEAFPRTESGTG